MKYILWPQHVPTNGTTVKWKMENGYTGFNCNLYVGHLFVRRMFWYIFFGINHSLQSRLVVMQNILPTHCLNQVSCLFCNDCNALKVEFNGFVAFYFWILTFACTKFKHMNSICLKLNWNDEIWFLTVYSFCVDFLFQLICSIMLMSSRTEHFKWTFYAGAITTPIYLKVLKSKQRKKYHFVQDNSFKLKQHLFLAHKQTANT